MTTAMQLQPHSPADSAPDATFDFRVTVVEPPDRVFVGGQEARLLAPINLVLVAGNRLILAACVTVPGLMCHCDGDVEGHPRVLAVEVVPCGYGSDGGQLYWDTGFIVEAPGIGHEEEDAR